MRFQFAPTDGPDLASAEALQKIAIQHERIADEMEDPDDE